MFISNSNTSKMRLVIVEAQDIKMHRDNHLGIAIIHGCIQYTYLLADNKAR